MPTGPLTALPFHLLVTQKQALTAPDASGFGPYRDAAFAVLPSVPSLKALRMSAREGQAPKILSGRVKIDTCLYGLLARRGA